MACAMNDPLRCAKRYGLVKSGYTLFAFAVFAFAVFALGGCSSPSPEEPGPLKEEPAPEATPVWYAGFERGWPAAWTDYEPAAPGCASNDRQDGSCWSIIGPKQGEAPVLEGDSVYRARVFHPHPAEGKSHRPYPTVHLEDVDEDFPDGVPSPVVNRFYVRYGWDRVGADLNAWHSFVTLANSAKWEGPRYLWLLYGLSCYSAPSSLLSR